MAVWGILGGSFDPPHSGHLALADAAISFASLSGVYIIPAHNPPHKLEKKQTAAALRLKMCQALCQGQERLKVLALELHRNGPSYTIDTVRELQQQYPQDRFRLILGTDLIPSLGSWYKAEELIALSSPLIAERLGFQLDADLEVCGVDNLSQSAVAILQSGRFCFAPHAASSTAIREKIAKNESVPADWLPQTVWEIIVKNKLYYDKL